MIRGVIFDLDGVLADTQTLHAEVEAMILAECGVALSPAEITRRFAGMSDVDFFTAVFREHRVGLENVAPAITRKRQRMASFAPECLRPTAGALELVSRLTADGWSLAVASGSPLRFIERALGIIGLAGRFAAIVSADDVRRGKPDPDIFLLAAAQLGVVPAECVVIEDGIHGMIAARRAGMRCVALAADGDRRAYPADLVVDRLDSLTPARLRTL